MNLEKVTVEVSREVGSNFLTDFEVGDLVVIEDLYVDARYVGHVCLVTTFGLVSLCNPHYAWVRASQIEMQQIPIPFCKKLPQGTSFILTQE
jgi:hypothetical protein